MRIETSRIAFTSQHEAEQNSLSYVHRLADKMTTVTRMQESERLSVAARGNVVLEGGSSMDVSMNGFLGRYDAYQVTMTQNIAQMMDPLVVNLKGALARLDPSKTFAFDLNNDGTKDEISLLDAHNGFLALDLNENGAIDDGKELFGTKSGDGFSDLAAYDEDKNGWIDENDSIFSKLQIWQKNALEDKLISLSQAKVGALLLENVDTSFAYKNKTDTNGSLQQSSVVLFENGQSGWMSHVDFALPQTKEATNTSDMTSNTTSDTSTNNLSALGHSMLSKLQSASHSAQGDDLLQSLKNRLKMLQNKLAKTKDQDEKTTIVMQILKISTQIMQLGG